MSLTIADLAWIAGVMDLKARIRLQTNQERKGRKQLFLYVETKEIQIVRQLCSLTGNKHELKEQMEISGPIYDLENGKIFIRRGCAEHCPDQHIHVATKTMPAVNRWTVSGVIAGVVIFNVLPFLITDKGYGELLDKIILDCPKSEHDRGRAQIDRSIGRMEALGWKIPDTLRSIEYLERLERLETDTLGSAVKATATAKVTRVAKVAKSAARKR